MSQQMSQPQQKSQKRKFSARTKKSKDFNNLDLNETYSIKEYNELNNYLKVNPNFEIVNKQLISVDYSPMAIEAVTHEISRQLGNWNIANTNGIGIVTTSKGGFDFNVTINSQKIRAPDIAFTPEDTFLSLDENQLWSFKGQPFTPKFIVEVADISRKDVGNKIDAKIKRDYFANGTSVELGWLIDPKNCAIWVYKRNKNNAPYRRRREWKDLEAGDILPGFTLELGLINNIINKFSESDDDDDDEDEDEKSRKKRIKRKPDVCPYCDAEYKEPYKMMQHINKNHIKD
ncbi:hypothetical protein RclHR1_17560002 [Rhizophagus clarus]|uniref:C2H2-type domain-containing protein n=1 Tax=Rhizophagus clarus TaxID=94130 RepID=A0A2Z6QKI8_9GLOM|nr:hypothetical protein RclHR1_17560002 [Rhizophagus clarus]GES75065.1 hypothetical protein GLOIN_2v1798071 [Rhizophagus clarus]